MKVLLHIYYPTLGNLVDFFKSADELFKNKKTCPVKVSAATLGTVKPEWDYSLSLVGDCIWECTYTQPLINEGRSFLRKKRLIEGTPGLEERGVLILPSTPEGVGEYLRHSREKQRNTIGLLDSEKGVRQLVSVQRNKRGVLCVDRGYKIVQEPGVIRLDFNNILFPVY